MAAIDDPNHFLELAGNHLQRVQDAVQDETDWSDLATYGLYCLEALVRAAVLKIGLVPKTTHWEKVDQAKILTRKHKLPDISRLLKDLNVIRKANAYGDSEFDESDFDADKIAADIEDYYKRVSKFSK